VTLILSFNIIDVDFSVRFETIYTNNITDIAIAPFNNLLWI